MPKISVVTAVFNRAETIAQAIESVAAQDHPDVEHVIQDGGSTDGTLEVIERVAGPNVRLVSARDGGIYDGINRGIARATGDIIGLMHSDDFFAAPTILSRVADTMGPAEALYGDLDYVAAEDTSRIIRKWRSGPPSPARWRRGWMVPHPTLYLRREVFNRFGLYDTSYRIAADYEAMLRYFPVGGVGLVYLPEVMVKMRVGGESNRSISRIWRKTREDYRALRSNRVGGAGTLLGKNLSKVRQFL